MQESQRKALKVARSAITQAQLALSGILTESDTMEKTMREVVESESRLDIAILLSVALTLHSVQEELLSLERMARE